MHIVGTKELEKPINQYTPKEHQRVRENYKALNPSYFAGDANVSNKIFACETTNESIGHLGDQQ